MSGYTQETVDLAIRQKDYRENQIMTIQAVTEAEYSRARHYLEKCEATTATPHMREAAAIVAILINDWLYEQDQPDQDCVDGKRPMHHRKSGPTTSYCTDCALERSAFAEILLSMNRLAGKVKP